MLSKVFATLALGLVLSALAPSTASAQVVRGTVIDSVTRAPLGGVTVALRTMSPDSSVAGAVTDSLGQFVIRAPESGIYLIMARRIGYVPLAGPPRQLDSGDVRHVRFELARNIVTLDSVVTTERWAVGITPGQQWFDKHVQEGKGMFFSGLDVLWSRITACDYFAKLPGLTYSTGLGVSGIRCHPTDMVITSESGSRCLAGRVDRHMRIVYMDTIAVYGLAPGVDSEPIMFTMNDVRGVEVFRNRDELPKDMSIPMPDDTSPDRIPAADARMTTNAVALQDCVWIQIWTTLAW